MNHSRKRVRRFLSAADGEKLPRYDLSGQQQRFQELHQALEGMNKDLSTVLGRELRRLLNHDSLQVNCEAWHFGAPEDRDFWLSAFSSVDPGSPVLLGVDRADVFGLSELFFGGDPARLAPQHIQGRELADTERRLSNRLLDLMITLLGGELKLPPMDWQSRWLEEKTAPPAESFWCVMRVVDDNWSLSFQCGWPLGLPAQDSSHAEVESDLRTALSQQLTRLSTRLKVEVGHVDMSLSALADLAVGDILPLDLGQEVTARAGDAPCVRGLVCENGDRLALRVTRVIGDEQ